MAFFLHPSSSTTLSLADPAYPQKISAGVVYEVTTVLTLPNDAVDTNVFPMIQVPAGARVVEVIASALTQAATFAVGDGDDPDRYITSAAVSAAAVTRLNKAVGMGYRYTVADTIDIVLGATPTDGGTITLTVLFVQE